MLSVCEPSGQNVRTGTGTSVGVDRNGHDRDRSEDVKIEPKKSLRKYSKNTESKPLKNTEYENESGSVPDVEVEGDINIDEETKLSQTVIERVRSYCQNVQISASDYFYEDNQKLACLVSNIDLIIKSASKVSTFNTSDKNRTTEGQDNHCSEDESDMTNLVSLTSASAPTTSIISSQSTVEYCGVKKIILDLKQQVNAFQVLASSPTPRLKIICQELTSILEGNSVSKTPKFVQNTVHIDSFSKTEVVSASDNTSTPEGATSIKTEKVDVDLEHWSSSNDNEQASSENENTFENDRGKVAVTPIKNSEKQKTVRNLILQNLNEDDSNADVTMELDQDEVDIPKREINDNSSADVDVDTEEDSEEGENSESDDEVEPLKKKLKIMHKQHKVVEPQEVKPPSLEEQVFGNQLLIKTIFKNLDTKSLKQIRVVNKSFNSFATEILLLRQSLKILISHDRIRLKRDDGQLVNLDLSQALQSLTASVTLFHRLPTDHLELLNTNLESPLLQNFLSHYGHLIKILKLDFYSGNVSIFAFQHLLLHQMPNLHTLHFDNVPPAWKKICADLNLFVDHEGPIKLKSLKRIKLGPQRTCVVPPKLLQHLVSAAVNLLEVKGCRGTNFLAFHPQTQNQNQESASSVSNSSRDFRVMKTLTFDPHPDNLELYQEFLDHHQRLSKESSSSTLQIQKLEIEMEELLAHPEAWSQVTSILTQFLNLNASTLEKIVINDRLGFLEKHQLQIPKLPKVKKLNIIIVEDHTLQDYQKKILPPNFQISENFPIVEILKIVIWENSDEEPCDLFFRYFGNPTVIPSVVNLELVCQWDCQLPLYWFEQFCGLVPNVKVANFGVVSIGDFVEASRCVWSQLLKLNRIKFTVDIDGMVMEGLMDTAFTGFSETTCRRLRKQQQNRMQSQFQIQNQMEILAEDWEDERESSSILDLKSLNNLRVDFVMKTARKNPYPVFLSCVTGLYAFQMCPKLKVFIGVDTSEGEDPTELNKCLETIRPYVMMDSSLN